MVRWTRLATVVSLIPLVSLIACTPFEAAPDGSATSSGGGGDPDAGADDGGPPDPADLDAASPPSPCGGAFFCDDFERNRLEGGPVSWTRAVSGDATVLVVPRAGRGRGLVARSDATGGDALITTERPLPSPGALRMTVKLSYELLEDGCSGDGYTDLVQVVLKDIGYMNLNFGTDCELHLSFGCEGPTSCDDWVPLLQGGRTRGRLHELVFGAHVSNGMVEGFYTLDGQGETSGIGFSPAVTAAPRLFVALGVDQAGGRTGVIGMRYEYITITQE